MTVPCAAHKQGGKASAPFKGFGTPPVKPKTKKRQQLQSQRALLGRPSLRGGSPSPTKRLETQQDAFLKIQTRASRHAELRVESEGTQTNSQETIYGPRGLLLVGFEQGDFEAVKEWFAAMEPDFRVSCCTDDLLALPCGEALMNADGSFRNHPDWQKPNELVPHIAIFSGLSEAEYFGLVQFWETTGIKQPIFSSAAEAMSRKPTRDILLEISRAYARSIKPEDDGAVTRDSLKKILRERMEAKAEGRAASGPIYI